MPSQAERRAATIAAILASARTLFADRGFEATSIDDIAIAAGVAKGAVYHHFASKEAIFVDVLDGAQQAIATAEPPPGIFQLADPVETIGAATLHYLTLVSEPESRRILLIDGPVVIGWRRWREIDDRYFGAGTKLAIRALLGPAASDAEVEAAAHLVMGAVMECALVCGAADDPIAAARQLVGELKRMLAGLRR